MYMSRLSINTGSNPDRPCPGRLWLRNLYHVHQRLCMAFPSTERKSEDEEFIKPYNSDDFACGQVRVKRGGESGFLFRIEPKPGGSVVLGVQSALEPDWDYAFHNAGYLLAAHPDVRPFNPAFVTGESLRFRLLANPTRKIDTKSGPDGQKNNGNRVPVPDDQLLDWLVRRSEGWALIDRDRTTIQPGYVYFKKDEKGQRLRSVRYDGLLTVTDPDNLQAAIVQGIGSAKGFGFGLLSVAPVR